MERANIGIDIKACELVSYPLTFELGIKKLPKKTWVKISQIRTLSRNRIGKKIANVSDEKLSLIIEGLNEIIGG
jgi:mRNA interferase MazF